MTKAELEKVMRNANFDTKVFYIESLSDLTSDNPFWHCTEVGAIYISDSSDIEAGIYLYAK